MDSPLSLFPVLLRLLPRDDVVERFADLARSTRRLVIISLGRAAATVQSPLAKVHRDLN